MQKIKKSLSKRRNIGLIVLFAVAFLGYFTHKYYPLYPPLYIQADWRMPLVYFLIAYKVIELGVFYVLFYRKHYLKVVETLFHTHFLVVFKKNAKRFFFLVPQGSIVFGVLAYKLSGEIKYLWAFVCLAIITLLIVNPKKLKESHDEDITEDIIGT